MTDAEHAGSDQPPSRWQAMVNEVQARIDAVDAALASLRVAVSHLTLAAEREPATEAVEPAAALALQPPPEAVAPEPPAYDFEAAREEAHRAMEEIRSESVTNGTKASEAWTMPRDDWPGWSTPQVRQEQAPMSEEELARDEVRRAVEEAKAEIARGDLSSNAFSLDTDMEGVPAAEDSAGASDKPEVAVESSTQPEAEVQSDPYAAWDDEEEARREAVRLAVERAKLEMENGAFADQLSKEPAWLGAAEAAHDEIGWPAEQPSSETLGTTAVSSEGAAEDSIPDDEQAAREEVRRAVEQMRGEISLDAPSTAFNDPFDFGAEGDEEAKRDGVRRAVEEARAEIDLAGGLSMYDNTAPPEADGLKPEETRNLFAAFAGADMDADRHLPEPELINLPASIVIEDPVGRVELARVYDTLDRVERSQAALLNYTPHSVTVGLAARDTLPDTEVMKMAITRAFGRGCRITTDGTKMSVKIGDVERAA